MIDFLCDSTSYIHDLNPIIFRITDAIALRWYGVAYLMGFVGGYFLLCYLSRKRLYPVPPDKMADFITYTAIFGVLLGGRLGYVLFYQIPNLGWDHFFADPLMALRVWEGGMASHGGMIGVGLYSFYYARKHRVQWVTLLDGLAIVAPVGLFFGRLANFINGELYGRIVPPGSSQGMIFPTELAQDSSLFVKVASRVYETPDLMNQLALSGSPVPDRMDAAWIADRVRDTPAVRNIVAELMQGHARYPSQLYEAFAEGVVLFAVLWLLRVRFPRAWNGVFCGVFALVYAIGRIVCEEFREPDSPLSIGLTRGQFLSVFLFLVSAGFFFYAFKTRKSVRDCVFHESETENQEEEAK